MYQKARISKWTLYVIICLFSQSNQVHAQVNTTRDELKSQNEFREFDTFRYLKAKGFVTGSGSAMAMNADSHKSIEKYPEI